MKTLIMENPDEISANGLMPDFIRTKTDKFEKILSDYKVEIFGKPHPASSPIFGGPGGEWVSADFSDINPLFLIHF